MPRICSFIHLFQYVFETFSSTGSQFTFDCTYHNSIPEILMKTTEVKLPLKSCECIRKKIKCDENNKNLNPKKKAINGDATLYRIRFKTGNMERMHVGYFKYLPECYSITILHINTSSLPCTKILLCVLFCVF